MKKQLEKELQELAQNIISTKDNLDLLSLKKETEKLLEKVSILNFVEKYYNSVGSSEDRLQYTMKKVADFIEENQEDDIFNLPVETTQVQKIVLSQKEKTSCETEKATCNKEESSIKTGYTPVESQKNSAYKAYQDIVQKTQTHQETSKQPAYNEQSAQAERKVVEPVKTQQGQPLEDFISQTQHPVFEKKEETESKATSLNDRLGKTAQIGLNDRLAFIRQLFFGSESEYNSVVQHINDLQSVEEIALYIEQEIKPIYNHWRGKEDYEERFLSLMLKRFEI